MMEAHQHAVAATSARELELGSFLSCGQPQLSASSHHDHDNELPLTASTAPHCKQQVHRELIAKMVRYPV